ncbi:MAG: hypothetical protein WC462_05160 [archaeon]
MMSLIYVFFILGSFPIGYLLLRTGFPLAQNLSGLKKIGISYLIGLIIFGTPIFFLNFFEINENYFFAVCFVFLTMAFIILYAKRITFKETDPKIIEEKKNIKGIPKITGGTKEEQKKIVFEQGLMVKSNKREGETKKQVFKEKEDNILKVIERKTKEIESETREKEKKEALKKLRNFAQQVKSSDSRKKKTELDKANEMNEIEEDLLNNLEEIDEIK